MVLRTVGTVSYKFVGRSRNGLSYIFESTQSTTGDSRVEQVTVGIRYFWGSHAEREAQRREVGVGTTT